MARQRRSPEKPLLNRVLSRTRELAQEVRETAERVQQQAKEAHRLTELARQQTERGRELSEAGREEAREVVNSIKWSIDPGGNDKRTAVKDENSLVFAIQQRSWVSAPRERIPRDVTINR